MRIRGEGFEIRSVDEREAGAILGVYRQCGDFLSICPVPTASMDMVLEDLRHSRGEGGVFCGIYVGEEMAGVIDFVPEGFGGMPGTAFLSLLMIAAGHRGRGLGRGAVRAVEAELLKNPGIAEIRLGAQADNAGGLAFWKRMGYAICGGPKRLPDTTVCYDFVKTVRRDGSDAVS